MTRRSRGREVALQVLYQLEQNSGIVNPEVRRFIERRALGERELVFFTIGLVEGVKKHKDQIDESIKQVAENWRLDRMAAIDRNILRLGAYEILHGETPAKVAINEALELAKRYSTAQSSRFVNGILDKLLQTNKTGRAGDEDQEDAAPAAPGPPAEEGPAA
jgi:N utilization substance protein B